MTTLEKLLALKALGMLNMTKVAEISGVPNYVIQRNLAQKVEFDEKQGREIMRALGVICETVGNSDQTI